MAESEREILDTEDIILLACRPKKHEVKIQEYGDAVKFTILLDGKWKDFYFTHEEAKIQDFINAGYDVTRFNP